MIQIKTFSANIYECEGNGSKHSKQILHEEVNQCLREHPNADKPEWLQSNCPKSIGFITVLTAIVSWHEPDPE